MARRALGPASLQVAQAVDAMLPTAGDVVLGVSGGADSMALAAGAAWVVARRARAGEPCCAVQAIVVDHGLQAGSGDIAARVVGRLDALGVAAEVVVADLPQVPLANVESVARHARLAALLGGAPVVMLGHTLDDQAETVLLGLARGSGARSLAGMAPRSAAPVGVGELLRPLLGLRRQVTVDACREQGIEVWADPHNSDDRFTRVRVRRQVMPALEEQLGPGIAEALARTARLARRDADTLDALAGMHASTCRVGEGLHAVELAALPEALSSRIVHGWLVEQGVAQPSAAHVEAVLALVTDWRGQGPLSLPGAEISRHGVFVMAQPS